MAFDENRAQLFDEWPDRYDTAVTASDDDFPFAGYQQTLAAAVQSAEPQPGMRVLDLGIGAGNLSTPFLAAGCQVYGLDFSAAMLAQAQARLPQLPLPRPISRRPGPSPGNASLTALSPLTSYTNLTCRQKSAFCARRRVSSNSRRADHCRRHCLCDDGRPHRRGAAVGRPLG